MADLSPIACEICRQKKRGCDRRLPYCFQCTKTPSRCTYPEINKRGLPLGYLTKVEERLAETEAALFAALSILADQGPLSQLELAEHIGVSNSGLPRQSKAERTQEWEKLPLRTSDDVMGWYRVRAQSLGQRTRDANRAEMPPLQEPGPESQFSRIQSDGSPVLEGGALMDASSVDRVCPGPMTPGKAEALTKSKRHLYF